MDSSTPPANSEANLSPRRVIKTEDGFLAYYFSARVANLIVSFTHKRLQFISPDVFTVSSLFLGLFAAGLFGYGTYPALVIGVVILHISFIFDCCDGQLARLQNLKIERGAWFDYHSDKIKDGALLFGFAYGAFRVGQAEEWILLIAFAGIFFQFLRNINALNRDIFFLQKTGKKDKPRTVLAPTSGSQLLRTLKHSSLFKLSDRVLLYTVTGLLGVAPVGVIIYMLLAAFFSTASGLINYQVFEKYDKTQQL